MLAYFIPTENRYVRTQGEAKKLGFGEATDIPLDKDGLLDFLNNLRLELAADKRESEGDTAYVDDAPPLPVQDPYLVGISAGGGEAAVEALEAKPRVDLSARTVLSRMDNPNMPIDSVVETIAKMKGGYALSRVAGAVATRFQELANNA